MTLVGTEDGLLSEITKERKVGRTAYETKGKQATDGEGRPSFNKCSAHMRKRNGLERRGEDKTAQH